MSVDINDAFAHDIHDDRVEDPNNDGTYNARNKSGHANIHLR
jgi:hypothetical protein